MKYKATLTARSDDYILALVEDLSPSLAVMKCAVKLSVRYGWQEFENETKLFDEAITAYDPMDSLPQTFSNERYIIVVETVFNTEGE